METRKEKVDRSQVDLRTQALEQELRNLTRLYEETKGKLAESEKIKTIAPAGISQPATSSSEIQKI